MFSLNVPVPGAIHQRINELQPQLVGCEMVREEHTLVLKRFPEIDGEPTTQLARLQERLRPVLSETPAVEASVRGIETFEQPARGEGPVVYLAVESPGLEQIHQTLTDAFGAVPELEGEAYVPHITLGRGGSPQTIDQLQATAFEPISWTVSELVIWDAQYGEPASRYGLPR